ncbi:hypothetical protein BB780_08300 [Stenotrophomonas maltophilia]|nr:hypothetical protein BB780_08300 [Stenotrophomonas maltophilia]
MARSPLIMLAGLRAKSVGGLSVEEVDLTVGSIQQQVIKAVAIEVANMRAAARGDLPLRLWGEAQSAITASVADLESAALLQDEYVSPSITVEISGHQLTAHIPGSA